VGFEASASHGSTSSGFFQFGINSDDRTMSSLSRDARARSLDPHLLMGILGGSSNSRLRLATLFILYCFSTDYYCRRDHHSDSSLGRLIPNKSFQPQVMYVAFDHF
jgi:hypothetical protein